MLTLFVKENVVDGGTTLTKEYHQWHKYCGWKEQFGCSRQELAHNDMDTTNCENDIMRDSEWRRNNNAWHCVTMI